MNIVFYEAPMSSAVPVAAALSELEVPHERVRVDLSTPEKWKPELLKLNPNGKVPTLVVDGTPMFEALAIMQWLGDRFGVAKGLWPAADAPERLTAMAWSTWAYVSYGTGLTLWNFATSERVPAQLHSKELAEHARKGLDEHLGILNRHLEGRPYVLGDSYSLADLIVASVVSYGEMVKVTTDAFGNVKAWLGRYQSRPKVRAVWAAA